MCEGMPYMVVLMYINHLSLPAMCVQTIAECLQLQSALSITYTVFYAWNNSAMTIL